MLIGWRRCVRHVRRQGGELFDKKWAVHVRYVAHQRTSVSSKYLGVLPAIINNLATLRLMVAQTQFIVLVATRRRAEHRHAFIQEWLLRLRNTLEFPQ